VYKLLEDKAFTDFADTLTTKNMSTKQWSTSRVKVLDNVIIGKRVLEKFLVSTTTIVNNFLQNLPKDKSIPELQYYPKGSCGFASNVLGYVLDLVLNQPIYYVWGERSDEQSHAWLEIGGYVVDITGNQFADKKRPNTFVVEKNMSQWYDQFRDQEKRLWKPELLSLNELRVVQGLPKDWFKLEEPANDEKQTRKNECLTQ